MGVWTVGRMEALKGAGAFEGDAGGADLAGADRSIAVGAIFRAVLEVELALVLERGALQCRHAGQQ